MSSDVERITDREVRQPHPRLKPSVAAYIWRGSILNLLTAPVIYSLLIPMALIDAWVTAYQWICFPIFGVARVRRRDHFMIDRHKLAYLNGIEKINCTFCSYANGVIGYVREVAARTEQYWCPIKHAKAAPAPHARYRQFFAYGNAEDYWRGLRALRDTLRPAAESRRRAPTAHRRRVAP